MLKMFKNRKAQNTAEYAILIAMLIGALIAMQTWLQRFFSARWRAAGIAMVNTTKDTMSTTLQYEPYYATSSTDRTRTESTTTTQNGVSGSTNTTMTGSEGTTWNASTLSTSEGGLEEIPTGY
jgi:hypothetical protein